MAILLLAVGAMMIPAMPFAMADPSAGGTGSILQDEIVLLTITEADPITRATIGKEIAVYNQEATDPKIQTGFACPLTDDGPAGILSPVWQLQESGTGALIGYEFDGNRGKGIPGQITLSFGTGDTNPVTVTANSEAQITIGGVPIGAKGVDLVDGAEWKAFFVIEPNTGVGSGLPRFMSMLTCGTEGVNDFVVGVNFQIVKQVGGGTIEVDIDIKPNSDPSCFNSNGQGVIPVAILGTEDFDVTQIDPTTITLDGQPVKTKGNGDPMAAIEDVNDDGFDDLVVKIVDENSYPPGDGTGTINGELFDGTPIEGTDSICITQ